MPNSLSRREFLQLSKLAAAGLVLNSLKTPGVEQPGSQHQLVLPVIQQAAAGLPLPVLAWNRLAYGPRPGDIEAFNALPGKSAVEKLAAFVEEQLDPGTIDDSDCEARLENAGFETLGKSLEDLWDDHIANNPYDDNSEERWRWYEQPMRELEAATFLRMVYSRRQLGEVLTEFWHDHFNVYGWHESYSPVFVPFDRDVIRAQRLGNFRQMLEAVATSPAMLFYLDNASSSDAGPNENFARELLELHTLGAGAYLGVRKPQDVPGFSTGASQGYVDNDVYETARAFTGWRVEDNLWDSEDGVGNTGRFLYYRPWHDRFNKLILGRYLPADQADQQDGRDVLDILAAHPATAEHIARKLCRRFVGDTPPAALVQAAAAEFTRSQKASDQLARVVRTILLSEQFRAAGGQKFKRPREAAVSMLRALQADFVRPSDGFLWLYGMMGQPIFGHHPPDGYSDLGIDWTNSMSVLHRWNLAVAVVEGWLDDDGSRPMHVDLLGQTPWTVRSARALVDHWSRRLLGRLPPTDERQALVDFIRQDWGPDEALPDDHREAWLAGLVEVIIMSPAFQAR